MAYSLARKLPFEVAQGPSTKELEDTLLKVRVPAFGLFPPAERSCHGRELRGYSSSRWPP
jgi:hypothetical protein